MSQRDLSNNPAREQATTKTMDKAPSVNYQAINLSDLVIERKSGDPTPEQIASASADGGRAKRAVEDSYTISDKLGRFDPSEASSRFLVSLSRKTGISKDYFKVFSPGEVLDRIVSKDGDKQIVVATDSQKVALGITRPDDTLIKADQALKVIQGFDPIAMSYADGELRATFNPTRGGGSTAISGEDFAKKFQISVPVDGLGMPSLSPILLRLICTNGLVGEGPAFSSEIKIGRSDAGFTLERALSTYSGDQPFAQIAERLEQNRAAYASASEVIQFTELLMRHHADPKVTRTVWSHAQTKRSLYTQAGGYVSEKLLRKIATSLCRYDLINMVTEVRSHLATTVQMVRALDAFAAGLLSRDPDMEGMIDQAARQKPVDLFFAKAA